MLGIGASPIFPELPRYVFQPLVEKGFELFKPVTWALALAIGAVAVGMSLFGIRNFGFVSSLPLLILAGASGVPFCKYVNAVNQGG